MKFAPAALGIFFLALAAWPQNSGAAKKGAPAKQSKSAPKKAARRTYKAPVKRAPAITYAQRQEANADVAEVLSVEPEYFGNGAGLVPFFERLYRSQTEPRPVHVIHYGDSHTASDDLAATLREAMQTRFGNGGPGFTMPGNPYLGFRRRDLAQYYNSRGWMTEGALFRKGDGRHGMGGVSLTAYRPGETLGLRAGGDTAELLFLQQPGGGSFELWIDGQPRGAYSTDGPLGPASLDMTTVPGERQFLVKTSSGGPVRLLGAMIDNASGVTWETCGINGAQASIIGEWEPRIMAAHLAKRDPALIVLAYGTNEANGPAWDPDGYAASLRQVLAKLRALAPLSSILLIGPPDCRIRSPRALDEAVELQRKIAAEMRCGFWDWRGRMGGPGSMRKWVVAGLAQYDYVHFTGPGYQLVGRTLFDDLMRLFDRFLRARVEVDDDKGR